MISKMVDDTNFTYSEFMIKQHSNMSDFSTIMDNKLTTQDAELIIWNNKSVKELHASQQQINEFFIKNSLSKNLGCNVETGLFYLSL